MKILEITQAVKDKAEDMGLMVVELLRDTEKKVTFVSIYCKQCEQITTIQQQTFGRWHKNSIKYCGICHGSNKSIPDHFRIIRLNESRPEVYKTKVEVVEYLGYESSKDHSYCSVKFLDCGHTKKYSTSTLKNLFKQGKALRCDMCYAKRQDCTSSMEKWASGLLSSFDFKHQVKYHEIAPTDKTRWVADFYSPSLQIIIEVTTQGQALKADYNNNLQDKLEWAKTNGIDLRIVSNINELEDIVQSLVKAKESGLNGPLVI